MTDDAGKYVLWSVERFGRLYLYLGEVGADHPIFETGMPVRDDLEDAPPPEAFRRDDPLHKEFCLDCIEGRGCLTAIWH